MVLVAVLLLLVLLIVFAVRRTDHLEPETIFVSVASYRDPSCLRTINFLFSNAKKPDLIVVVGICQQNKHEDDGCLDPAWRHRIRMIRLPHHDAKGPTWARYLCSTLWDGETYFLQIDSHTTFARHWDAKLIGMIKGLRAKGVHKPVLSTYPRNDTEYTSPRVNDHIPVICKSFFNDRNLISFPGAEFVGPDRQMIPTPYVSGGLLFAPAEILKEVPYDPYLPNLVVGEEILHSIRLWTHGWDIFAPTENVVFHCYERQGEPKFWEDNHFAIDDKDAVDKVRFLLGLKDAPSALPRGVSLNIDKYGLGTKRSLQDYLAFAGINIERQEVTRNFCTDTDVPEVYEKYKYLPPSSTGVVQT